jgi:hypothetical protein
MTPTRFAACMHGKDLNNGRQETSPTPRQNNDKNREDHSFIQPNSNLFKKTSIQHLFHLQFLHIHIYLS